MAERLLVVDDEAGIRRTLSEILTDEGYRVSAVGTAAQALERLEGDRYDLVLLDIWLPDRDGLELLEELRQRQFDRPVIVISGHGNIDSAVKAVRLGAYDFLEKPLSLSRVVVTVQNALERLRLAREVAQLSDRLARTEPLLGDATAMRRLKEQIERAAASESRILILGENGTGKELVARQVHGLSRRANRPFVPVNCAAIPEELIESELFGHIKGAFTGAASDRAGRFEQADGGTIFLDEVGDMSLNTQAKVLRVLQEQRFERVGGSRLIEVDVRVVAATNKDLHREISDGRFRDDLYFRLAVIPLEVPPLRERTEDVRLLLDHFLATFAAEMGRRPKKVEPEALRILQAHPWPGNVRELKNLAERLMIMAPGEGIKKEDLPTHLRASAAPGTGAGGTTPAPWDDDHATLREARAAFEKHYIERKLAEHDGNVTKTAQALGIERSHLYRKMRSLGVG